MRGTAVTLRCPRCGEPHAPGPERRLVTCARCELTYTPEVGERQPEVRAVVQRRAVDRRKVELADLASRLLALEQEALAAPPVTPGQPLHPVVELIYALIERAAERRAMALRFHLVEGQLAVHELLDGAWLAHGLNPNLCGALGVAFVELTEAVPGEPMLAFRIRAPYDHVGTWHAGMALIAGGPVIFLERAGPARESAFGAMHRALERGVEHVERGELALASTALREVIHRNKLYVGAPDIRAIHARYLLGLVALQLERLAEARRLLREATEASRGVDLPHELQVAIAYWTGVAAFDLGDGVGAAEAFERAIALGKGVPSSLDRMARAWQLLVQCATGRRAAGTALDVLLGGMTDPADRNAVTLLRARGALARNQLKDAAADYGSLRLEDLTRPSELDRFADVLDKLRRPSTEVRARAAARRAELRRVPWPDGP